MTCPVCNGFHSASCPQCGYDNEEVTEEHTEEEPAQEQYKGPEEDDIPW